MYKIAVVGDYASIYGFSAVGLDIFPVKDPNEGEEIIRRLSGSKYAVIYVTEELASRIPSEMERLRGIRNPAVIMIPGISGNTGAGIAGVKHNVEQAVGSDILFSNK
ncbi:MAG: V-type ATP synthase subunit F [Lachnospiraceae bacterium]|nr:V-type ATP synthase subunit F [Lachnospiraceae bacterium]